MPEHLHEGVDIKTIKTIGKLIDATIDGIDSGTGTVKDKYSYSSAAKAASKLIAVYPILASKSMSLETLTRITRFIEQKGCIILRLALQMSNISNSSTGIEYLKKFHQNLDVGGDEVNALGDIINAMIGDMNDLASGQDFGTIVNGESATVSGNMLRQSILETILENEDYTSDDSIRISVQQMNELMQLFSDAEKYQIYDTNLNEKSINDFVVKESEDGTYSVSVRYLTEASGKGGKGRTRRGHYGGRVSMDDNVATPGRASRVATAYDDVYEGGHARIDFTLAQQIKKMNEAVPSLLIVRFYNSSNATVATEFIVGVKAKVLAVNPSEILRRIANDNEDGKSFLNLMRTITGELKVTEFLFGLSRIKQDLKSTKVKGALGDTWNLLQNRAAAAKTAVARGQQNNFAAITTVVISREDADDLFREENIDITNPKVAKHFMESYNLMGFMIADDATESLKMIFDDGSTTFEEVAYRTLERDHDQKETYKGLVKLLADRR